MLCSTWIATDQTPLNSTLQNWLCWWLTSFLLKDTLLLLLRPSNLLEPHASLSRNYQASLVNWQQVVGGTIKPQFLKSDNKKCWVSWGSDPDKVLHVSINALRIWCGEATGSHWRETKRCWPVALLAMGLLGWLKTIYCMWLRREISKIN